LALRVAGKHHPATIVPEKSHSTTRCQKVEQKLRTRHIFEMPAKPRDKRKAATKPAAERPVDPPARPKEIGGPQGPEPTRYGDWEIGGRCTDF